MSSLDRSQLLVVDRSAQESKPHGSHISIASSSKMYKPYRYRFLITLLYCLASMINAITWICTSPITTNLEAIYGLDIFTVTFCTSIIWFLVYPPMNFIANYVLDEKGLQIGVFVGGSLTIVGLWLRTLNDISFYFIFAGQLLAAIGQPFLMNAPQKLSAVWYAPQERALATTIASVANPVGVGVGFLLAQNFVDVDADGDTGKHQVNKLMFFTAILGSVLILPSYFLFKKKPPTPPSRSADTEKYNYKESLMHLLKDKNYLIYIISVGLVFGSFNVMATALQPLVYPYNFSSVDSGNLGAITLICGLVGSVIWGLFCDRTKRFKLSLICCTALELVALGALAFTTRFENFGLLAASTAAYGFFATPVFPLAYELCAELSFPTAEAAASGLMVVMTQLVGLGGTLGLDALLKENTKEHTQICFAIVGGLTFLGLIGLIITKEELKRTQLEKEGEDLSVPEAGKNSKKSSKAKSAVYPSDETGLRASLMATGS